MATRRARSASPPTTCTPASGPTAATIRIAWRRSSPSSTPTSSRCRSSPIRPASRWKRARPVVLTTLDSYECALGPTRQNVTQCFGNALFTRHPHRRGPSHRPVDGARGSRAARWRRRSTSAARWCTCSRRTWGFAFTNGDFRCGRSWTISTRCATRCSSSSATSTTGCRDARSSHVLDHRLGRPPRPASFPVSWPIVALDRIWVHPDARPAPDLPACDARRTRRIGSLSCRRGDRLSYYVTV